MLEQNLQSHNNNRSDANVIPGVIPGFIIAQEKLTIPYLSKLCLYSCDYNNDDYRMELFSKLNITYPKHLHKAVNERQGEYLAGRYSAMLALQDLKIEAVNVATGQHRSPVWPKAVVGSITHTKSKAYAAVAYRTDFSYIGIDYEACIDEKAATSIHSSIANEHEIKLVMDAYADFSLALTIIFSAKESLFKALYPYVGRYFAFSAASIISLVAEKQRFTVALDHSFNKNLPKGRCFTGWFYPESGHVFTVIAGSL